MWRHSVATCMFIRSYECELWVRMGEWIYVDWNWQQGALAIVANQHLWFGLQIQRKWTMVKMNDKELQSKIHLRSMSVKLKWICTDSYMKTALGFWFSFIWIFFKFYHQQKSDGEKYPIRLSKWAWIWANRWTKPMIQIHNVQFFRHFFVFSEQN